MLKLKKSKLLLAVSLALVLFCASASAVFAAEPGSDNGQPIVINGTADAPAQAAITKNLQMPVGTAIPTDAKFEFKVTPKTVDDVAYNTVTPNMPPLNSSNLSVTYPGAAAAVNDGVSDVQTATLETGDIFAGVPWTHAGVYVYEIAETPDTYPAVADHEVMTYSGAVYTITAFVESDGNGGFFVSGIGDMITVADNGDQTPGDKVDPTPGGNVITDTGYSDMVFTNTYVHTNGSPDPGNPDPADPTEATLTVSKVVSGTLASQDQYFNFSMALAVPSLVANAPASYDAYVVDTTVTPNAVVGAAIPVSTDSATPTSFQLKHGQDLVFINTPVGTGYSVQELNPAGYIPSYVITTNGMAATAVDTYNLGDTAATGDQRVGEAANKAAFTNTRDMLAPTGLNMNQLPFIGLIILMAGALAAFIVVKSRKREYYGR